MFYTHIENRLRTARHQGQHQNLLRGRGRSGVALCLALLLVSGFAYADDIALTKEANAALAQKDYNAAFSKFSVLAQHGNASAQFNLGAFYLNGQGVQKDEQQAIEWFEKSAAQGDARALKVLQSAATKGNERAKNALNRIAQPAASAPTQTPATSQQTSTAPGNENSLWEEANAALAQKDYNAAFPKFLTLAQQGNATAQFNVGAFYFNGQGVKRDEKQASEWFEKSAAQGNARALEVVKSQAAKRNENAKNAQQSPAQTTTAVPPSNKPDVKVGGGAETEGNTSVSHAESVPPSGAVPSAYSLGVSVGQTGKLDGISNSSSFGLLAGYKINSRFGLELAYSSLYRNANANTVLSAAYPGTTGTFDLSSLSVAGQYTYGFSSNLSLLGNLGVHTSSYKLNSSGNGAKTGNSSGLIVGIKIQYDLSKNLGIRGGFDTYTEGGGMTGNLTEVGMSVISKF